LILRELPFDFARYTWPGKLGPRSGSDKATAPKTARPAGDGSRIGAPALKLQFTKFVIYADKFCTIFPSARDSGRPQHYVLKTEFL